MILKQDPLCSSMQLNCAKNIKFEFENCLPPCSGLVVSSFSKTDANKNLDDLIYNEIISYEKFTRWTEFPEGLKGSTLILIYKECSA